MIGKKEKEKEEERINLLEFEGITFEVSRRKVKHARIEFKPPRMVLIVSKRTKPLDVLERNRESILRKCRKVQAQAEAAQALELERRSEMKFQSLILEYTDFYSKRLRVAYKAIKYRKMKRRWGSCRTNGEITYNKYLRFLPDRLVAYVVHHELVHLRIRGHNTKFKAAIAKEFHHHRELDKELTLYGIRLLH